ncbi:MAG: tRNA dihydrouridine(20/20a) synthase DusA [Alphaproteobacteria bacterium]
MKKLSAHQTQQGDKMSITPVSSDLISIAPMLDWTDRHFRYFLRLICHNAMFYTEMTASPALILGDRAKLLAYNPVEQPLTLQVGGSEPNLMARCAVYAQEWGYKAVNINAGCPSSRVQSGRFGAILMQTPALVADCVAGMRAAVSIPVTVKTRISLNDAPGDGFENLFRFTDLIHHAGCRHLIVHARQAKLNLSPKDNRDKLPLHYELVYKLKKSFPDMFITINGNIKSLDEAATHLTRVDGVMIGRVAYGNPYALRDMDARFFNDKHPILTREEILEQMLPYIESYNGPKHHITHHMLGLYHGQPNAKAYKLVMATGDVEGIKEFLKSTVTPR